MNTSYFNGEYIISDKISFFDRGFHFADSIFDVILILDNVIVDFEKHLQSLQNSLKELDIKKPNVNFEEIIKNLISINKSQNNNLHSLKCYIQITRGNNNTIRSHWDANIDDSSLYITLEHINIEHFPNNLKKISFACIQDKRHAFSYIKTTNMLANIMAKKEAFKLNAQEALLVDKNQNFIVREGASCNIFIIKNDTIFTPLADKLIYNGNTRQRIIKLINYMGYKLKEKNLYKDDLQKADSIFTTASISLIRSVNKILDHNEIIYKNETIHPFIQKIAKQYFEQICKKSHFVKNNIKN